MVCSFFLKNALSSVLNKLCSGHPFPKEHQGCWSDAQDHPVQGVTQTERHQPCPLWSSALTGQHSLLCQLCTFQENQIYTHTLPLCLPLDIIKNLHSLMIHQHLGASSAFCFSPSPIFASP